MTDNIEQGSCFLRKTKAQML